MTAGARDTVVIFELRETTQDPAYGTTIEGDWAEHSKAWAEVVDVLPSRAESIDDSIAIQRSPARVRIDQMDGVGVTSSMRIRIEADALWPERILRIVSGPAFKRDSRELEFMVEQLSSSGEEA